MYVSSPAETIILEMDDSHHPQYQPAEDQQQLTVVRQPDSYLESRAEAMKTIESTIVELGTMFTQLATMVKEQDEMVLRWVNQRLNGVILCSEKYTKTLISVMLNR